MSQERELIRVAIDINTFEPLVNVLTNEPVKFWRNSDVQFDFFISVGGVPIEATALNNYETLTLMLKSATDIDGAYYIKVDQTVFDDQVTAETWADGTAQHASFLFSRPSTNLALGGKKSLSFWLVLYGTTKENPETQYTLAASNITVLESGVVGEGSPITPNYSGVRISSQGNLQILNLDNNLWYDLVSRIQNQTPVLSLEGAGES